jgi:hypothetical protein
MTRYRIKKNGGFSDTLFRIIDGKVVAIYLDLVGIKGIWVYNKKHNGYHFKSKRSSDGAICSHLFRKKIGEETDIDVNMHQLEGIGLRYEYDDE